MVFVVLCPGTPGGSTGSGSGGPKVVPSWGHMFYIGLYRKNVLKYLLV